MCASQVVASMDPIHKTGVRIPQELVDITIDHLYDDKAALSKLTLVTRTWLPLVRRYLFHTITVTADGMNATKEFEDFKDFLLSPQGVSSFIRHLRCANKGITHYVLPRLDANLLGCVLSNLANLECLTLDAIRWGSVSGGDYCGLPGLPSPIPLRSLRLASILVEGEDSGDDPDAEQLDYFTSLIRLFSSVDDFYCDVRLVDCDIGGFSYVAASPPRDPWTNPGFKIKSFSCDQYTDWMVSEVVRNSASSGILKDIDISLANWDAVAAYSAMAREVGQGIEHITLRTTWPDDILELYSEDHFLVGPNSDGAHRQVFDLSGCSSLKSICIYFPLSRSDNEFSQRVFGYVTDVVNVTPPSVCRVEFKVDARAWGPPIDLAEMDLEWGRLEQILRKRPNLQEVVFKVETESFL